MSAPSEAEPLVAVVTPALNDAEKIPPRGREDRTGVESQPVVSAGG